MEKEGDASVMKVAITIWGTRISPVFDSARNLLVAEIEGVEIVDRKSTSFDAHLFNRFVMLLLELEVQVLICGALCEGPARILEAHGIEVISFMTGEAESVLESFVQGRDLAEFSLPGCRWGMCRRRQGGRKITNHVPEEDGICLGLISRAREEKGR
jgi:predicted Fe-Mo cluster-binding NifX family protein